MTALGYTALFFIFIAAYLVANLGASYIGYRLQRRAMLRQQREAIAAFQEAMSEDCGDPNCPVHGTGSDAAPQEAMKN